MTADKCPKPLELLAPAKNLECGIAAVDHGADAVYIGAPRFGARAAAGNSIEDVAALCDYAHRFGVRVYVTANTLIREDELDDVHNMLAEVKKAGVDAVLIQDMALLDMCRELGLEVHASTQTDNRTAEKVERLRDIGFSRVVLARELSLQEISDIHQRVPDIEVEAFVHGALCVSYSGRCYASEYCFGRSANRGECAQFCRLKFDLVDADGNEYIHQRHLLSLKDMCRIDDLGALAAVGVVSFKIEGRLKDAAYVKNVVAAYSQRLDKIVAESQGRYVRASQGKVEYAFEPDLHKTFNRGYTDYFLYGRKADMASINTPKSMGMPVGKVKRVQASRDGRAATVIVSGTSEFANGDGLCFFNSLGELEGFRVNRAEGNHLILNRLPVNLREGMTLYRNNDMAFVNLLSGKSATRKIPVRLTLAKTDTGFMLTLRQINANTNTNLCPPFPSGEGRGEAVNSQCDCEHKLAEKPQQENIVRQLTRLGNTPYTCSEVEIEGDAGNYFIPNSVLARLRRDVVDSPLPLEMTPTLTLNQRSTKGGNFSTQKEPLMQCRYCLLHELGHCRKKKGEAVRTPLFLRLSDGRKFRLAFDCNHCQMNLSPEYNR